VAAERGGDVVAALLFDRDRCQGDRCDSPRRRDERAMAGGRLVERQPGKSGRRPEGDGCPAEAEQASPARDEKLLK